MLGNENATKEQLDKAVKMAYLNDFLDTMKDGLDTQIGERGVLLSGGQKQRVAIARAFLKNAPILILDEATSELDAENEMLIENSLEKLMEGKTVIAIAHKLNTLKKMDRIIVLENGKIVEQGSHNELISVKNGVYKKLWEIQKATTIMMED